jgi:PAS domain S-box-containing protein
LFWNNKRGNKSTENIVREDESLIEAIADGVVVTDITGKIKLFNKAACDMSEWSVTDAMGLDIGLVMNIVQENSEPFDAGKNPFKSVLATGKKSEVTAKLISHSGKTKTMSLVVSPVIVGNQNTGLVAVIRDITAQKSVEKQRTDFVSTASHEMRTPLATIEGYISLAMNTKISDTEKMKVYLSKAHDSILHLSRLFQDLLTTSSAEDGRLVNRPRVLDVGKYFDDRADSFQIAAKKKGLTVDFVSIGSGGVTQSSTEKIVDPIYYVYVDIDRFSELINNLFDNAVKYTKAGKITIGIGGDDKIVQIFIRDSGIGIPPTDVPHLFQKFYRVDNSEVRTIGGTGLGLFICKNIVQLYGGQIWVESELGKGSTFRINLPRLNSGRAETLLKSEAAENHPEMVSSKLTS